MSIPMKDPRLARAAARSDERLMQVADMPDDVDEDQILGEQAVLAFAGTDLPGLEVLNSIRLLSEDCVRAVAEAYASGDESPVASELRGTLLAVFLFGYFAREEVDRAGEESWSTAVALRAAEAERRASRGEPVTAEDVIAVALYRPETYSVVVGLREEAQGDDRVVREDDGVADREEEGRGNVHAPGDTRDVANVPPQRLEELTSEELTALADLAARSARVWTQMAEAGHVLESTKLQPVDVAEHYRERARYYKELAAAEEREQTEFEEKTDD